MPELPEVETIRRDLATILTGMRIRSIWSSGKPLRMNRPIDMAAVEGLSVGCRIVEVMRLAKYLLIYTDAGGAVVVHLGMSGNLHVESERSPRAPHTHFVWTLERGRELRFVDPRRFGSIGTLVRGEEESLGVGVEPLGPQLSVRYLGELLAQTRRPIKTLLLDQKKVAGLGNIYVCEALFGAGIHPSTPAYLAQGNAAKLRTAIRAVLRKSIANRGTTLRDYTDASKRSGQNQRTLQVYGREGDPCFYCGNPIARQIDSNRSTFFCPGCQPLPTE